jgi:hypothetical protein
MKTYKLIGILCIFLISCKLETKVDSNDSVVNEKTDQENNCKDSTAIVGCSFVVGDGLGGAGITFNEDLTFSQYGFCDICPGNYSFGYYTISNDTLIKTDTLCFVTEPHFANPEDTIPCKDLGIDTLYIWKMKEGVFLNDTVMHQISANSEKFYVFWRKK